MSSQDGLSKAAVLVSGDDVRCPDVTDTFYLSQNVVSLSTKAADDVYSMNHLRRGVCVIVSQELFDRHTDQRDRLSSSVDAMNLQRTFSALSFEVHMFANLSIKETLEELDHWSKYDHTNCDAFVLCYLSHGERDLVFATDGKFPTDHLFNPFTGDKCASLVGKPKLFFIQACRGTAHEKGVSVVDQTDNSSGDVYRLPAYADFVMAYSTVPDYVAWRNDEIGSWFIQALCEVLQDMNLVHDRDILSLLTIVKKRVAFNFEALTDGFKQIPWTAYTLTRNLYLSPN